MILAEIDKKGEESSKEWYPGKYVGLPEPGRGEWLVIFRILPMVDISFRYFGKRLGIKKKNSSDLEPTVPNIKPLVWQNVQQLTEDLSETQHIEGVNAVLEVIEFPFFLIYLQSCVVQQLMTILI